MIIIGIFILINIFFEAVPFVFSIFANFSQKTTLQEQLNSDSKSLKINPVSEYNFLTKEEIYKIREEYIKDSIFYRNDYAPNEEVFGQIVDRKPWVNMFNCHEDNYEGDYSYRIKGDSKLSIYINNPSVLVGLIPQFSIYKNKETINYCKDEYAKFIPYSLKYDKKNNLITVKYKVGKDFTKLQLYFKERNIPFRMQLCGINAKDLGYSYVYSPFVENIQMVETDNNITKNVSRFEDFIHLGGSCKYEGGCNNISPMQNDKAFSIIFLPAQIDLKLWKQEPKNKRQIADINYRMIFEEI